VSFGIKTSQSNLMYDEILRTWREADEVPVRPRNATGPWWRGHDQHDSQ
jgi:hypothetical protein